MKKALTLSIALLLLFCTTIELSALPVVTTSEDNNPFVVRHQEVNVEVYNHLIRTNVTQLLLNNSEKDIPCSFDLFLPEGAHASSLEAEINGKKYVGRIETVSVARDIVEESKNEQKVAALAEERDGVLHIEFSMVKANSEILLNISYIEEAVYENSAFQYWFGIDRFSKELALPDSFTMDVTFKCTTGITNVSSNNHTLIGKINGKTASFTVEDIGIVKKNFHMTYSLDLKPGEPNLMLLTRESEDPYFALLSLPPDAPTENTSRSLIFILDKSGSMQGEKFSLAVSSLIQFIDKLRPNDIFNVFIFDSEYSYCSPLPFKADSKGKAEAKKFIDNFNAGGGTYILGPTVDALEQLKFDENNPTALVLLTDGQGLIPASSFIKQIDTKFQFKVPMFVFAIGLDLNVPLLRSLARHSGGSFSQVIENKDIATSLASIRSKFDNICGFNLDLKTNNNSGYFRVPKRLSHLYKNELIRIAGRFDANKKITLSISADTTSGKWAKSLNVNTIDNFEDCPFLDQGWGIKRIESLLDDDSNFGPNAKRTQEIIVLSKKYLISTRYTSLVFSELSEERQNEIIEEGRLGKIGTGASAKSLPGGGFGGPVVSKKSVSRSRGGRRIQGLGSDKCKETDGKRKPPKWYDETNQLLDSTGKPLKNQILAHSMLCYTFQGRTDEPARTYRIKSATWLAVHSQEGVFSKDILEQVMATAALNGARNIDKGISKIVDAATVAIRARDLSTDLDSKGTEYTLAVAFFYNLLLEAGITLPEAQRSVLKKKVLEGFGGCNFAAIPYGKTFEEISKWTTYVPIVASLKNLLAIPVDDSSLILAAKVTRPYNISTPNVIYWLSWKRLQHSGKVKKFSNRFRQIQTKDLLAKPSEGIFSQAIGTRLASLLSQ